MRDDSQHGVGEEMVTDNLGQGLLPLEGIPEPDFDDKEAGRIANLIVRPYMKAHYSPEKTRQTRGFLMKELKAFVLECVVRGDTPSDYVQEALMQIGAQNRVVTEVTLQVQVNRVKRQRRIMASRGMNSDAGTGNSFHAYLERVEDSQSPHAPF